MSRRGHAASSAPTCGVATIRSASSSSRKTSTWWSAPAPSKGARSCEFSTGEGIAAARYCSGVQSSVWSAGGGEVVRANWSIFEEDYWAIRSVLTELLKNSNAQSVLLIDRTGQLISSLG